MIRGGSMIRPRLKNQPRITICLVVMSLLRIQQACPTDAPHDSLTELCLSIFNDSPEELVAETIDKMKNRGDYTSIRSLLNEWRIRPGDYKQILDSSLTLGLD